MAFDSLGQFIGALQRTGELAVVRARVSPVLEIAEITDRVVKAGGPALLFTDVAGSAYPVLTNAFGTERRMALGLGARSLSELEARMRTLVDVSIPGTLPGRLSKVASLGSLGMAIPRRAKIVPVQEIVEEPDLATLPILTTWPGDGGRFITLPLVFTRDPLSGARNVGMYRMHVYDARTTGMHWQRHKQGRAHATNAGSRLPVAVVIGADPALTYAATAPLPPVIDEVLFAGILRGRGLRMARCTTIDVDVPADAEFVLEGYVDNEDLRQEGPFGDHTGVYTPADAYPTFHVQCITRRRAPTYAATVVGKPPMEDAWLGKATERLFLPLLQMVVPEIVDYNLPVEGAFHNLCIVSIRKSYPGHAQKVMNALWGLGHMLMLTRVLVIVDADIDVQDVRAVTWFVANNIDPSRDLVVMPGPVDDLDHSSSSFAAFGHKLGIDATRKARADGYTREWPADLVMDDATRDRVTGRWAEYGFHFKPKADRWSGQGEDAVARLLAEPREGARKR